VFSVISEYAIKKDLPVRVPRVSFGFIKPGLQFKSIKPIFRKLILGILIMLDYGKFGNGFVKPDKFFSIYDYIPLPSHIQAKHYIGLLRFARARIIEIMVHPAYVTSGLKKMFSEAKIKEQELVALCSFSLNKAAEQNGFTVVSYKEIYEENLLCHRSL
jgi:hypothetical protein